MQIQDLPYPDPGVPDARSGPRFLWWLGRNQLGGQFKALAWGLLHFVAVSGLPFCVGLAIQAVVDRSGTRLALTGGLMVLCGLGIALGDTMLHRTAVTNWITAAARVQQLLARKTAQLGSALTRRVAAGEVVAVSTGDVEKIGWFVEALSRFAAAALTVVLVCVALVVYQPALGVIVAVGMPVLALAVLPLLPRATRRADFQREKAGRATELASDTVAGLRVLRGIGGEELFLDRYRRASQEVRRAAVRSARMWSLISAIQVLLPGLLLIAVVWRGVHLARDGKITVGELVTVYSAVMLLTYPLRHFEEIAMAYSFSRPSAKRAARVLSLERAMDSDGSRAAEVPGGDLYDPSTGLLAPSGRLTAVVCGDPDTAGLLAERLGGHPSEEGTSALLGAYRWTNCRWTPPAAPSSSRTRTRCCCPARCASCSTSPRPVSSPPRTPWPPRSAATSWTRWRRGRWTPRTRWTPGSPNADAPCRAASASVWRSPARCSRTPRYSSWTSRRPPSTRTPRPGSPTACAPCAPGARRWSSPPLRCSWTTRTGSCWSTRARSRRSACTANWCAANRVTGPW